MYNGCTLMDVAETSRLEPHVVLNVVGPQTCSRLYVEDQSQKRTFLATSPHNLFSGKFLRFCMRLQSSSPHDVVCFNVYNTLKKTQQITYVVDGNSDHKPVEAIVCL